MSDVIKTLQAEAEKLAHEMRSMIKDKKSDEGFSKEEAEKFDKMADRQSELEARIARQPKIDALAESRDAGLDLSGIDDPEKTADLEKRFGVEDTNTLKPEYASAPNVEPKLLNRDERDYAMRGFCLGNRAPELFKNLAERCEMRATGDTQRIQFRSNRGTDKHGNMIRLPQEPPEIRDGGRYRPRRVSDLRELYEQRAIGLATPVAGPGSNTVPDELMRPLEEALLRWGGMRLMSTIIQTSTGANLPIPTVDDTLNKGRILAEAGDASTGGTHDLTFNQRTMTAFKYTSDLVPVSIEFLQDTSIDAFGVIGRLLGIRVGRITNEHFTTGAGTTEPVGILDATDGATDSTIVQGTLGTWTWMELVDLMHSVDPAYANAPGAGFMMNWQTLGVLKKIRDSQNRPLWMPSVAGGEPAMILDRPYVINQDFPDSSGVNDKSLVFGDLTAYTIRDVLGFDLMILRERYAELGQIAFVGFSRHDGKLIRGAADANTAAHPIKYAANAAA